MTAVASDYPPKIEVIRNRSESSVSVANEVPLGGVIFVTALPSRRRILFTPEEVEGLNRIKDAPVDPDDELVALFKRNRL